MRLKPISLRLRTMTQLRLLAALALLALASTAATPCMAQDDDPVVTE